MHCDCIYNSKLIFGNQDINECAYRNGNCSHICSNTLGSVICSCMTGYVLNADLRTCDGKMSTTNYVENKNNVWFLYLDINECAVNIGNCSQLCNNINGSYVCSCWTGYGLNSDNKTCSGKLFYMFDGKIYIDILFIDVNECALNNGGCSQECTNTVGGSICSCKPGYSLNDDNRTCAGKYINYLT